MEKSTTHLMIVAGEASGDMHAAHLVDQIKALDPSITFSGVGGRAMEKNGVELYSHLADLAVVGFTEVFRHLGEIRAVFRLILDKVDETKAQAVILVDFPGFNLRLAKELKKRGVKVFYYISPQVWAWKENRVKLIKEYVDEMFVLFPFEEEFYRKHDYPVHFVGHPLLDMIKPKMSREHLLSSLGLSCDKLTIGIFPGSRKIEIERLLPIMLDTARILSQENKNVQFLLSRAPTITKEFMEKHIRLTDLPLKIFDQPGYDGLNACDVCMVTSGTATLETAILEKPMVVVYKTSFLTYLLARLFIKIPYIGLVNVVAGKKIVPECIQFEATPKNISTHLKEIFTNEIKSAETHSELQKLKNLLGEPGASHRAARKILELI
ncbi:MAG: lipid-A-disaccharide synthase [Candidatus Omnitrophota bacterium]